MSTRDPTTETSPSAEIPTEPQPVSYTHLTLLSHNLS